jgi:hypothetical protein
MCYECLGYGLSQLAYYVFPSIYGITLAQTSLYYRMFPDDAKELKYLVGIISTYD